MSRRDDVSIKYEKSNKLSNMCNYVFIIIFLCAILSCFFDGCILTALIWIQIVLTFISVFLQVIDDSYFWFSAEETRRKSTISNAYGVNNQPEITDGYYNNNLAPSLFKHSVNVFESNYFSYEISSKMITLSIVKMILSFSVIIVSIRFINDDELLLTIAGTLFSSSCIADTIKLIIYNNKMKKLYDDAYRFFITDNSDSSNISWIQTYIIEYECVKAYFKVRLDSKIFDKMNSKLSQNWKDINKNINSTP